MAQKHGHDDGLIALVASKSPENVDSDAPSKIYIAVDAATYSSRLLRAMVESNDVDNNDTKKEGGEDEDGCVLVTVPVPVASKKVVDFIGEYMNHVWQQEHNIQNSGSTSSSSAVRASASCSLRKKTIFPLPRPIHSKQLQNVLSDWDIEFMLKCSGLVSDDNDKEDDGSNKPPPPKMFSTPPLTKESFLEAIAKREGAAFQLHPQLIQLAEAANYLDMVNLLNIVAAFIATIMYRRIVAVGGHYADCAGLLLAFSQFFGPTQRDQNLNDNNDDPFYHLNQDFLGLVVEYVITDNPRFAIRLSAVTPSLRGAVAAVDALTTQNFGDEQNESLFDEGHHASIAQNKKNMFNSYTWRLTDPDEVLLLREKLLFSGDTTYVRVSCNSNSCSDIVSLACAIRAIDVPIDFEEELNENDLLAAQANVKGLVSKARSVDLSGPPPSRGMLLGSRDTKHQQRAGLYKDMMLSSCPDLSSQFVKAMKERKGSPRAAAAVLGDLHLRHMLRHLVFAAECEFRTPDLQFTIQNLKNLVTLDLSRMRMVAEDTIAAVCFVNTSATP